MLQLLVGLLAVVGSALYGRTVYISVWVAVGLTACGVSMYRRGVALRPRWNHSDISAARLTNLHHLTALIGGGIILLLREKTLSGSTAAFFIIESAFLLIYVNFILLSSALKIAVDRSTWVAFLLLTAAWYSTFEQIT